MWLSLLLSKNAHSMHFLFGIELCGDSVPENVVLDCNIVELNVDYLDRGAPYFAALASDSAKCPPENSTGPVGDGEGEPLVVSGKLKDVRTCNEQPCPSIYWHMDPVSACSSSCGGGVRQMKFSCISGTEIVANSVCIDASLPLPSDIQPCNEEKCLPFHWKIFSSWSKCNVACGNGNSNSDGRLLC